MQSSLPKFELGEIVATPGALAAFEASEEWPIFYLLRHAWGEWDPHELDESDRHANDDAIASGLRILSAYRLKTGVRFWVITEGDRSSTTFLLPAEY